MSTLFTKKSSAFKPAPSALDTLFQSIQSTLNEHQITNPTLTRSALSLESLSDSQQHNLNTASDTLSCALEGIASDLKISGITRSQLDAATAAGILAGDVRGFMGHKLDMPSISTENMSLVNMVGITDSLNARPSLEAYDERENRNAAAYSIAYNLMSARQDEFGETFFPTITVTPDNVGFSITVRLMTVYNAFTRNVSGAVDNYNRKNLIRAFADASILKNESTRCIPVVRPAALANFVNPALIPARTLDLEGEAILTAPLAVGKKFSLLAISQTDTMLSGGVSDMTDSLDPAIELQSVYVQVGDDILVFNVSNLPLVVFAPSVQNNYKMMTLNFDTTSILINKNTKRADGSALTTLASVVTNDLILRVNLAMSGFVNVETADTAIYGNTIGLSSARNSAGELLDKATAPVSDLNTLLDGAKILGYDLKAYHSNANMRQRGQLINTTHQTQLYTVPLRAPVTAIHPVTTDGQVDTGDLTTLITTTRIRTSNASVTALLTAASLLREYVDSRDENGVGPDIMGVGRYYVRASYFEENINMLSVVDSIKSYERAADTQAALVNKLRDYAYRMYRDSEYKAAADALSGGIAPIPTVIIGTDPVLSRYLTVSGDLRTLGNDFNVRIVSTLDKRVSGKIFMTFGVFDENRNVAPNPLNFGNMAWSPELTIILPISRNGQISKENSVRPRFLHMTNLPIMTVLTIEGIPQVMNKVPLNFHTV